MNNEVQHPVLLLQTGVFNGAMVTCENFSSMSSEANVVIDALNECTDPITPIGTALPARKA